MAQSENEALNAVIAPLLPCRDWNSPPLDDSGVILALMEGLVEPPLSLAPDSWHIRIPHDATMRMSGRTALVRALHTDVFFALPRRLQRRLLETLLACLRGNLYQVVRFRCFGTCATHPPPLHTYRTTPSTLPSSPCCRFYRTSQLRNGCCIGG